VGNETEKKKGGGGGVVEEREIHNFLNEFLYFLEDQVSG